MSALEETLVPIAEDVHLVRYTSVATATFILYEYLITIDQEIRLVWPSKWSLVKVLFFINRYLPFASSIIGLHMFITAPGTSNCKVILYESSLINTTVHAISSLILLIRVYAIWSNRKTVLAILIAAYIPTATVAYYITTHMTKEASAFTIPYLFPTGCLVSFSDRRYWIAYTMLLCFETLMIILILVKALFLSTHIYSSILNMMVKDGVFYYACILSAVMGNLLVLLLASPRINDFLLILLGMLHSVLSSRLLFRLRDAHNNFSVRGPNSHSWKIAMQPIGSSGSRGQSDGTWPAIYNHNDLLNST